MLGRAEEWIKSAAGYTVEVFSVTHEIKQWNPLLVPLAVKMGWIPGVTRLREHHHAVVEWLKPEISRRRQCMQGGWGKEEKPDDVLQWMLDRADTFRQESDADLAHYQMSLGMAAIHSTTSTGTQAIFDLALHPHYVEPLRAELRRELGATGGRWTKEALHNCKLLDSFVRESQRLNPVVMAVSKRTVKTGITLRNGVYLPPGALVMAPAEAVNADARLYCEPARFDGYRSYNARTG